MDSIPPRLSSAYIAWMTTNFAHQCKGNSSLEIKITTSEGGRVSFPLIYKREGAGEEKRDWWCKHFFFFFFTQPWRASISLRAAEGHRHLGRWRLQRGATVVQDKSRRISDRISTGVMHGTPEKKNVQSVSKSRWFCMSGWDEMLAGWLRKWWVCHTDARGLFAPSPQAFLGASITT